MNAIIHQALANIESMNTIDTFEMPFQHELMSTVTRIRYFVGIHQACADIIGIQHSMTGYIAQATATISADVGISANVHPKVTVKCLHAPDALFRHHQTI